MPRLLLNELWLLHRGADLKKGITVALLDEGKSNTTVA